jgi:hypothetical protein
MSGTRDEQSMRLDAAFREVSTGRAPDAPAPAPDPAPTEPPARAGLQREVTAALAEAGVVQELARLSEAVEALGRRLDELVARLDEAAEVVDGAPADGAGRVPLLQNLRSISTSRTGRAR